MLIIVTPDHRAAFAGRRVRCALGRSGIRPADAKREGDGFTPAGNWPLRRLLWRPDRLPRPVSGLPTRPIGLRDGWCDDPDHPDYNQPVTLPHPASAEHMWREDNLYDLVVVLGHNDSPVEPGAGSAIFLHVAAPDYAPTQGCVALAKNDLTELIRLAQPGDTLQILAPEAGPPS